MSDLLPARIVSFEETAGFGQLEFEDGSQRNFDYSVCAGFEPKAGVNVLVELGTTRRGRSIVKKVEEADS